jgi:hypothetical protein
MSPRAKASDAPAAAYLRISARRILAVSPVIRFTLQPGDRALVAPGQPIEAGTPIAERTLDVDITDVGRLGSHNNSAGPAAATAAAPASLPAPLWKSSTEAPLNVPPPVVKPVEEPHEPQEPQERRRPPVPGKWWVGGDERRGRAAGRKEARMKVAGTLLFEMDGRWRAATGERQQAVLAPTSGVVVESRNGIAVTLEAAGAAIVGVIAGGSPSRGRLDVPKLVDGELGALTLDVSKAGSIVVAGGRISAEALTRARAMNVRGMIAGSLGSGELRDLAASEARQQGGLHDVAPFGVLALDGHQRRPIASPILTLLTALSGREAAIVTDPPLLVLDAMDVPVPRLPSDWVRVRSGPHAGREGRWTGSAGLRRFKAGIHLEAANVRLGDDKEPTVIPLADLERFVF